MRYNRPPPPVAIRLPANVAGRDFVVGDVSLRGDFATIDDAMANRDFDPACDRLFCVGHVGADAETAQDVKALIGFLGRPHVFAVRGEREERLIVLASAGCLDSKTNPQAAGLMRVNRTPWFLAAEAEDRARILELITALPVAIETTSETGGVSGYVHAQVPVGLSWQSFMRSLNDADGYTTDMAIFGRYPTSPTAAQEAAPAVGGAETVFVCHAATLSMLAAALRPRNVLHVDSLQRSINGNVAPSKPILDPFAMVARAMRRLRTFAHLNTAPRAPRQVVMR